MADERQTRAFEPASRLHAASVQSPDFQPETRRDGRLEIAAVQIATQIGNVSRNLEQVEALATEAFASGAKVVALPEFFTGALAPSADAFRTAMPPDNAGVAMLTRLAKAHHGYIGGSMLIADGGDLFNRYYLVGPDGERYSHDKDIPTMWENSFYTGGGDDGVFATGIGRIGAAMCWEMLRQATVHRIRGRVDFALAGMHWWGVPWNWPGKRSAKEQAQSDNARMSECAASEFARRIGAPVVLASHCGPLRGDFYLLPGLNLRVPYETSFVGCTQIVDAQGRVLASRSAAEGVGIVSGTIGVSAAPGQLSESATAAAPEYWIPELTGGMKFFWAYQNYVSRSVYRRFGRQRGLAAAGGVE